MLAFITSIVLMVVTAIFSKRYFIKKLQQRYESSLLKGDKKRSIKLGKLYYHSLDETVRLSKGIVDIDAKISEDFRAFNNHHFILL